MIESARERKWGVMEVLSKCVQIEYFLNVKTVTVTQCELKKTTKLVNVTCVQMKALPLYA